MGVANWRWRSLLAVSGAGAGELTIAPRLWGVVGRTLRVYVDSLLTADEDGAADVVGDYTWTAWCPGGGSLASHLWSWAPSAGGTWPLIVRQYDSAGAQVGHVEAVVAVVPDATVTLSVTMIGDSLTAGNTGELVDKVGAIASSATFLGTQTSTGDRGHDGWSGSDAEKWTTDPDSPLVTDGELDAVTYLAGLEATPDCVVIMLGINRVATASIGTWEAVVDDEIDRMEAMGQALLAAGVSAILYCYTTPGNPAQAAWSNDYGGTSYEEQYRWEVRQREQARRQVAQWAGREDRGVYVAPVWTAIDPVAGYPALNALHPDTSGKEDEAEAIYAGLVVIFNAL